MIQEDSNNSNHKAESNVNEGVSTQSQLNYYYNYFEQQNKIVEENDTRKKSPTKITKKELLEKIDSDYNHNKKLLSNTYFKSIQELENEDIELKMKMNNLDVERENIAQKEFEIDDDRTIILDEQMELTKKLAELTQKLAELTQKLGKLDAKKKRIDEIKNSNEKQMNSILENRKLTSENKKHAEVVYNSKLKVLEEEKDNNKRILELNNFVSEVENAVNNNGSKIISDVSSSKY